VELVTIFYCLRFEALLFVASYEALRTTMEVFEPAFTRDEIPDPGFLLLIKV
jgi:hypothetical protein